MQKFIHDNFILDLSNYQINRVEDNQWFSDQFFSKYTFPFELYLTDEINSSLGLLSDYNIQDRRTLYKGYLFIDDGHEEAIMEVMEIQDRVATIEISYGFDSFPNFDKKLSELPLEKKNMEVALFDHAETVISQGYPTVNYNFVQVHTDSFNPEEERWAGFQKIINNRKDGSFLRNEFDAVENITYNRNIMIPMPYLLHVLVQGFQEAGYGLKGDILSDPHIPSMLFYRETEEYIHARIEGEELVADTASFYETFRRRHGYGIGEHHTATYGRYLHEYTFPYKGKYKVAGNIYLRRQRSEAFADIYYKGINLWYRYEDEFGLKNKNYSEKIKTVDIIIDVDNLSEKLRIRSDQIPYSYVNDLQVPDGPLIDLTITPLAIYDLGGNLIPPLVTTSRIDLTKCVPDVSFGDLVKMLKNWKNMEFKIKGRDVYMDYIEPQMEIVGAVDLTGYNSQSPRRQFKQGDSFLLQFKELDAPDFNPASLFVDVNGPQTTGYVKSEKTTDIAIDAVPLPNVFRNNVTTALAVDKGEGKMCIVLYNGLTGSDNLARDNSAVMIPAIYDAHWAKWLDFRIRSQTFITQFRAFRQNITGLRTDSKVFMYNNFHLIKSMNKTNIPGEDIYEVELELESLK